MINMAFIFLKIEIVLFLSDMKVNTTSHSILWNNHWRHFGSSLSRPYTVNTVIKHVRWTRLPHHVFPGGAAFSMQRSSWKSDDSFPPANVPAGRPSAILGHHLCPRCCVGVWAVVPSCRSLGGGARTSLLPPGALTFSTPTRAARQTARCGKL